MNPLVKCVIIAAILFMVEVVYFQVARHFHIADRPNTRSSHNDIIIRGGGIIFPLAMLLGCFFFGIDYKWFIAGLLLVALVSYWDDIHSLPDSVRLIAQTAAVFLMFMQTGFMKPSLWWVVLLGLILCVGIINAYNFMDGINGITGGYSLAVLISLMLTNRSLQFIDMSYLIVAAIGCMIFCFFNFRTHARCFAGDVGSISMAVIVLFPITQLIICTGDFSYIVFLALYGVDTVLTIVHRIMLHENLGQAHRKHAFQIMANELHIPHVVVSLGYTLLQLAVSIGLILLPDHHLIYSITSLLALGIAYIIFMKHYYPLHEQYLKSLKKK